MDSLTEIAARLTPAQLKDVETYAAGLAARHPDERTGTRVEGRPNRIRLEELNRLLVKMDDEMPWSEIKKRLRNEWADAAED